ncbi:MAG: 30S ribosomal protein S12 methylthiotransferase RimO [Lachnospiraceae bacterium]|nr:30S ribosomal protein S12 methylthiotransferase RimO [Lachnospiraceae bacterium]
MSLGCDKNLVDSERMMGFLSDADYLFTDDETDADVIIVNTCCFIGDAKEESIDQLIRLGKLKETGKLRVLIACGCLAQRYQEEIEKDLPEVDAIVGTMAIDQITEAIRACLGQEVTGSTDAAGANAAEADVPIAADGPVSRSDDVMVSGSVDAMVSGSADVSVSKTGDATVSESDHSLADADIPGRQCKLRRYIEDINRPVYKGRRVLSTGGHVAYLKIAEGCGKNCTYCIIPKVRGTYRSFPMEQLVSEAESLAKSGVRELILVAQETTLYGTDLYGKKSLPKLIDELTKIPGIKWIRLMYCYPEEITEEIAQMFAQQTKLVPYIDMPIQHASDEILRRMGRRTNRKQLSEKIAMLRKVCPDICIRTTLITGFPGETEEDVNTLADFMEEQRFDRLGVFTYSAEEDTAAAEFEDQIEEEEKQERLAYLMELQQQIAFEKAQSQVGKDLIVMIEGRLTDETETADHTWQYTYVARSYMDAPDIDGLVFVEADAELMSGDFARVRITEARDYDLVGVLADVGD